MDPVVVGAITASVILILLYLTKVGRPGITLTRLVLLFCTISLLFKASGHVWCSDGAGRDYGGFDYSLGNANVITTVLFLYGETQYVWIFWNLMFLFYDKENNWTGLAVRVHFFAAVLMISFIKFAWTYIKEFPIIMPPVGDAKRPGQYLWFAELGLTGLVILLQLFSKNNTKPLNNNYKNAK